MLGVYMLSLCMIVKDESKNIEKCILSVRKYLGKYINDYVVVDTGSKDNTVEILNRLECSVYNFEWINDFSKARNFSLNKAKNDWVLFLDADEFIESIDIKEFEKFLKNNNDKVVGLVDLQNIHFDNLVASGGLMLRIFNKSNYEFQGKVHESVVPKTNIQTISEKLNIIIRHTGYTEEALAEKNKVEVYKKMIEEELLEKPNDYQLITQLGSCYRGTGELDKAIECYEQIVFNEQCIGNTYYDMTVVEYIKTLIQLEQFTVAKVCENLWNICSHDDNYVYLMGYVYVHLGELESAIDCFLNCVNRTGTTRVDKNLSYIPLGSILEQLGDLEQALICYKAAGTFNDAHLKVKELEERIKSN